MTKIMKIDEMFNNNIDDYGVMIWSEDYGSHKANCPEFFNDDKIDENMFEELLEGDLLEIPLSAFIENLKELSNKTGLSVSLKINENDSWLGLYINDKSMYPFMACMTVIKNKKNILRPIVSDNVITVK